ncbi:hypothetical protein M5K25_015437 [Dendrobium thyrsiflorum]|uniref:Uncharacterized protein n=1 Tax=Dendrobium thyrsiflorum TaxID=117978 RepID=A0ABD0UQK5_DENTH
MNPELQTCSTSEVGGNMSLTKDKNLPQKVFYGVTIAITIDTPIVNSIERPKAMVEIKNINQKGRHVLDRPIGLVQPIHKGPAHGDRSGTRLPPLRAAPTACSNSRNMKANKNLDINGDQESGFFGRTSRRGDRTIEIRNFRSPHSTFRAMNASSILWGIGCERSDLFSVLTQGESYPTSSLGNNSNSLLPSPGRNLQGPPELLSTNFIPPQVGNNCKTWPSPSRLPLSSFARSTVSKFLLNTTRFVFSCSPSLLPEFPALALGFPSIRRFTNCCPRRIACCPLVPAGSFHCITIGEASPCCPAIHKVKNSDFLHGWLIQNETSALFMTSKASSTSSIQLYSTSIRRLITLLKDTWSVSWTLLLMTLRNNLATFNGILLRILRKGELLLRKKSCNPRLCPIFSDQRHDLAKDIRPKTEKMELEKH